MGSEISQPKRLAPEVRHKVQQYCRALRQAKVPFQQTIVFGSRAKGTAHSASDIDVAVVSDSFGRSYDEELSRLLKLRGLNLLEIEPHPFHPDDLNNRWSTLASEIRKYGIPVD